MSDDDIKTLSMGCTVDDGKAARQQAVQDTFDLAYEGGHALPRLSALGTHLSVGRDGKVEFFSASFVPAPKCEACQTTMEAATSLEWACPNDKCDKHGEHIHVGVYPLSKGVELPVTTPEKTWVELPTTPEETS